MDKEDIATLVYLEVFKTQREGMMAENDRRKFIGESQAYGEADFSELEREIRGLLSRLDGRP